MGRTCKVSVIILTYNSVSKLGKLFDKVLSSIFMQDYPNLEVIVVDNNSNDGTFEYVKKKYSSKYNLKVLRLKKNYGWGGGNNRGALLAKYSDFLLFVNDDAILGPNCVSKLVKVLNEHPNLAAVQPLIIEGNGNIICGLDMGFSGFSSIVSHIRSYPLSEAFYVSGAVFLTRTDVFFRSGMFDEDLFVYHDDTDYCWRLRLIGYKVACIADVYAYHFGSVTWGSGSPLQVYYIIRNNFLVIAKNSSLKWLIPRITLSLIVSIMFVFRFLYNKNKACLVAAIKGIIDGLRELKIGIMKRAYIRKIRKISDEEVNKALNKRVDVNLLLPQSVRKILGL
ncbi:glycosyltransferase family 2 protein [Desulfurococcaceae archaeon MEX13E-LK6-19]|nr:glycosyltransferase family 2 protein [Desulfurococcaceae archaeon MEX13E-LK6-19]